MITTRRGLLGALAFPILVLLLEAFLRGTIGAVGEKVTLPISGYDPRDLLAGHYLTFRVEYGVEGVCAYLSGDGEGYICLSNKTFSLAPPSDCRQLIKGVCRASRFEAGIERFYIPEKEGTYLEEQLREKTAAIVVALTPSGQAQIQELLIDGKPWGER